MTATDELRRMLDERGNFIYRAEFEGSFLSKDEAKELGKYVSGILDENHRLRELCEWLLTPYRLGAVTGEGVDKQWCRETYDGGSYRLRELGVDA